MTPPPPPPPPPPSFFQSYYRPQSKFHHRTGSLAHQQCEFNFSKIQKIPSSQKCATVEYSKSKQCQQQQKQNKYTNEDPLRRSARSLASYNLNSLNNESPTTTNTQNGHLKSRIYQQNHDGYHHSSKYSRNYSASSLMRQKSDQSENVDSKFSSNNSINKNEQLSIFDGSKKSRCILFSQIYFITHVSITICLNKTRDIQSSNANILNFISKDLVIDIYTLYILIISLIFFALIRYYAMPRFADNLTFNELTEQTPILFGAIFLSFSELAQCIMEMIDCIESDSFIIPAVKFTYQIAFMHFLLTQVIYNDYIGLRNIVIAHLLSTQISLWILSSFKSDTLTKSCCDYELNLGMFKMFLFNNNNNNNNTKEFNNLSNITENVLSDSFKISIFILNNQFKFLSVFILITMWFSNNQSKINFIRAKLSEEEVIRAAYLNSNSKQYLFRSFFIGSIFLLIAISTIIFSDNRIIQYSSSIFIQVLIAVIAVAGLLIRRHQMDLNDPKYQINILKHHFIIFVTMFMIYIVSMMNLVSLMTEILTNEDLLIINPSSTNDYILTVLLTISYFSLIIQVTIQTYLLRLQGKKLVNMTQISSLLAIANFSLWIIDLSTIVNDRHHWPIHLSLNNTNLENENTKSFNLIPSKYSDNYLKNILTIFIPLNRFYCSLIFCHFWKLKI